MIRGGSAVPVVPASLWESPEASAALMRKIITDPRSIGKEIIIILQAVSLDEILLSIGSTRYDIYGAQDSPKLDQR